MKTSVSSVPGLLTRFDETQQVLIAELTDSRLVDVTRIFDMGDYLGQLVREFSPELLIVDLGHVDVFSSEMIDAVLRLDRALRRNGGSVNVTGLRPTFREVFRMMDIERGTVPVYGSIKEAMADHQLSTCH